MSQVSKYKLNNKVYEKIFSLFPQFLHRMTKNNQDHLLFDTFFTRTERIVVAKRIAIAFMLVKGYSYNQIVSLIKVSHGTIAKIADSLSTHDQIIIKELERMSANETFIEFLDTIGYNLAKLLPPKGANWSKWRGALEKSHRDSKQPF